MTVAPLSALKDNLEHLHQKIDSLENTLDERLPSGTHILNNDGHINDRTGLANAGDTDDADHTSWATRMVVKPILMMMLPRLPLQLVWLLSPLPLLMALLTSRFVDLVVRLLPLVGTLHLRLFAL
jgi:hypothetical protein